MSYLFLVLVLFMGFSVVFVSIKEKNIILGIVGVILWGVILICCPRIVYSAIHSGACCVPATQGECSSVQGQGGNK